MSSNATECSVDEKELSKKLAEHFILVRDIAEKERLRSELDAATASLQLYEEYMKQKKKPRRSKTKEKFWMYFEKYFDQEILKMKSSSNSS